jgi:sugar phosphate isomerase/epimerase
MKFSLSVRIAEGFLSKEIPILPLEDVAILARRAGYQALCMRASQVGISSAHEDLANAVATVDRASLEVSMVTGNFDIVYNNERGPSALRKITPFLDLATQFGSSLVRVALKTQEDIEWAQKSADEAAERGLRLVHQCHTLSLFETVESIIGTLQAIDRPNFGLVYEPANLELCGENYGPDTIKRLAPWIFNVYLQNQVLRPAGAVTLNTWARGSVAFDILPISSPGGIHFPSIFEGLKSVGYHGYVTVHQSATQGETPTETAERSLEYLQSIV